MIISKIFIPAVIVSLPTVNELDSIIYKRHYTTVLTDCQQEEKPQPKFKTTMDYNYMTTEEWINSYIEKYNEILR
jgi:hypothetical protein